MLGLSITVTMDDGEEFVAEPTMGTLLRLERHYDLPSAINALQDMKLEHLAWLAWECRRHSGVTVQEYKKWSLGLLGMEFNADDPLAEPA